MLLEHSVNKLHVLRSEVILVITRMITDRIGLHSILLPLLEETFLPAPGNTFYLDEESVRHGASCHTQMQIRRGKYIKDFPSFFSSSRSILADCRYIELAFSRVQ